MVAQRNDNPLDFDLVRATLDKVEEALGVETVRPLRQLLELCLSVMAVLSAKKVSIERLRKMVFGSATERSANIFPTDPSSDPSAATASSTSTGDQPKRKRPNHGRTPARAYHGCETIVVTHPTLYPGDNCPDCGDGTLYRLANWSPEVRLRGQTPVVGTVYQLERLRCHLCGQIYTAELPPSAGPKKFDPSVASIVAVLRYGEGLPWNRLQRIQLAAGIPLPASTQWGVVRDALPDGIQAIYDWLLSLAAQRQLVHNDDTHMQILQLTAQKKRGQPLREDHPKRSGVFTTGILALDPGQPTIALFFTGPYHSGENLRELLQQRQPELPPPIQMCDALSRNMPSDLQLIVANCLAHGRRNFVELARVFREEVRFVLTCFAQVYQVDEQARREQLTPEQRLELHQRESQPAMDQLQQWMQQQFDEKLVEPNSALGLAIQYMQKYWEKLTRFLCVAGAPLDNNVCEQALKMAIRHRKNSLFYKTTRGAEVGDLYMSLIHTCYLCGADPFDYLTQLQRHAAEVLASPSHWLPWNYKQPQPTADHPPTDRGTPTPPAVPDS